MAWASAGRSKVSISRRARKGAEKDKEEVILGVTTKKILLSAFSASLREIIAFDSVLWDSRAKKRKATPDHEGTKGRKHEGRGGYRRIGAFFVVSSFRVFVVNDFDLVV